MTLQGCGGTASDSSQGGPKVTSIGDDKNRPTLADIIRSQESLLKDKARVRVNFLREAHKVKNLV